MSLRAANPTDLSHLSRHLVEQAKNSLHTRNGGGERRSCRGVISDAKGLAAVAGFSRGDADEGFALERVCRYVSRLCSGTASGLFMRPAGYGFPPNLVRKDRRKDFSGASVNADLRHLGAWPTRFIGAPIKIGKFNKRRQSCTKTK